MGSPMMRHPEEERLLRYADGEIAGREAAELREHLAACWECRTQLEEMQSTIGECVRYRRALKDGLVEPPPAPWFDIGLAMRQIDEEHSGPGWLSRAGAVVAGADADAALLGSGGTGLDAGGGAGAAIGGDAGGTGGRAVAAGRGGL